MKSIIEKLFAAADNHGTDTGESDHTVGDLQGLLRKAWDIMSVSQKLQLLNSTEVEDLVELGAQGDFKQDDLVANITKTLSEMEAVVSAAGYSFMENDSGFYWERDNEGSEDFHDREDAVADAHAHFNHHQAENQLGD